MKDTLCTIATRQSLSRAVTALGNMSEKDVLRVSVLDAAYILSALPNMAALRSVRTILAERLRAEIDLPWIEQGDALDVYAVLSALWRYDPSCITGDWL